MTMREGSGGIVTPQDNGYIGRIGKIAIKALMTVALSIRMTSVSFIGVAGHGRPISRAYQLKKNPHQS